MTLEIDSRPPSSLHITVPPLADETGALPVVRTGRRRQPPRRGDGAGDAAHHLSRVIHRPATRTTAHHRRNPARLRHSSVQKARRGRLPAPGVKYHPGGAKTPGNTPWRPTGACWDGARPGKQRGSGCATPGPFQLAVDTSPGQQAVRTSSRSPTLRGDHPPPNALIVPLGGQFPPT